MSSVLQDFIETEGLEPGDRLPPERDLAEKLGLPRTALRRILASMETEGRLMRHVGRGTFIAGRGVASKALSGVPTKLIESIRTYPAEVFETRLIVEPKVAGLAALRATPIEIDGLQKAISHGRAAKGLAEFEKWDAVFHRIVAQASRNGLLWSLYETIHMVRAGQLWGRMKEQSLTAERMKAYTAKHEDILRAIKDRDSATAEDQMRMHILEAKLNILGHAADV